VHQRAGDAPISKCDRLLCSALAAVLVSLLGCAPASQLLVVWYALSPTPNAFYPQGDSSSRISTWEQIKVFPTAELCEESLRELHNQINRPVECFPSNDRRLMNSRPARPEPLAAPPTKARST